MNERKSDATLLVEIATDIYVLGCTPGTRGSAGELVHEGEPWAAPKQAPDRQMPLADIRPLIADMFELKYDRAPGRTAIGDAMTVLAGRARQAAPAEPTTALAALLAARKPVSSRLVDMAREQYRLGVTANGDVFGVPADGPNVALPLRGRRSLRSELARAFYEKFEEPPGGQALADALLILEAEARQGDPEDLPVRAGRDPDTAGLVLDLGRDDGQVVTVTGTGWDIAPRSPTTFWETNATLPLPLPERGGDLTRLRDLLNVPEQDWPLLLAYLVAALVPDIPHPVLLLAGEHGTAKSCAARVLTSLADPCAAQLRSAPRNVIDWVVAAAASWITTLDNVSTIQPWLQDAICRASTGDGLVRRELYTDSDVTVLAFRRVVVLTSIDPGPLHGDLADRLLAVELDGIPEDRRRPEQAVMAQWRAMQPAVLGALLDLAADVLRVLPKVRAARLPRMADFARIVLAVDEVTGSDGYARYRDQAARTAEAVAESDSVVIVVRDRVKTPWSGTATGLLQLLTPPAPAADWPDTPRALAGRLSRAAPVLRQLGWKVERDRAAAQRTWRLTPPLDES